MLDISLIKIILYDIFITIPKCYIFKEKKT